MEALVKRGPFYVALQVWGGTLSNPTRVELYCGSRTRACDRRLSNSGGQAGRRRPLRHRERRRPAVSGRWLPL